MSNFIVFAVLIFTAQNRIRVQGLSDLVRAFPKCTLSLSLSRLALSLSLSL